MKRFAAIFMVCVLSCAFGGSVGFATQYYADCSRSLTPYGYGADYTGRITAVVYPAGGLKDVTGMKVRCKVICNGYIKTDSSNEDTIAPYEGYMSGSVSSSKYSNNWELDQYSHWRLSPNSAYSAPLMWVVNKSY